MTKAEQDKIIQQVKSILPAVVRFTKHHKFADFDFGYIYGAGVWEATFFNEDDEAVEYFTANTETDLVEMLQCETIAKWHNEDK